MRKLRNDIIIVLMFWSLYAPIALAFWYESGRKDSWITILVIGIVFVLLYLITSLILTKLRKKEEVMEEPEKIPLTKSSKDFSIPNLENVFKENFGVVTHDVD